jgi:hypothetical protein
MIADVITFAIAGIGLSRAFASMILYKRFLVCKDTVTKQR